MYQDKKWESFHSNKRCQLAYSKYQGKNELIKYINKKLGNYNINDNDNDKYHMKKSFFIKLMIMIMLMLMIMIIRRNHFL